jgi:hypothetical protein
MVNQWGRERERTGRHAPDSTARVANRTWEEKEKTKPGLRGGESAQFRRRGGKYRVDGTGENLQGTDHGHRNEGYEKSVFRHCCTLFVVYKFFN